MGRVWGSTSFHPTGTREQELPSEAKSLLSPQGMVSWDHFMVILFGGWGWNPGLCAGQAQALPLSCALAPHFHFIFFAVLGIEQVLHH